MGRVDSAEREDGWREEEGKGGRAEAAVVLGWPRSRQLRRPGALPGEHRTGVPTGPPGEMIRRSSEVGDWTLGGERAGALVNLLRRVWGVRSSGSVRSFSPQEIVLVMLEFLGDVRERLWRGEQRSEVTR